REDGSRRSEIGDRTTDLGPLTSDFGPRSSGLWWAAAGFLALTMLACLPLPEGLAALLSPTRVDWVRQSRELLEAAPGAVAISYAPAQSLAWWGFWLALALLFAALSRHLADRRFLTGTLWLLLAVAVAEAFYGILQALVPNLGVLWVTHIKAGMGNARGTYINRNHFAGFIEMLLPLLLGFALSRVRWHGRPSFRRLLHSERLHQHLLMALALVLMALALLFSKSRAGITGLFIGLFIFFSLVRDSSHDMPRGVWWMSGFFVALTLIYGWHIGYGPIIERFLALDQNISRLDYWRDSLPMIAAHPWGIGPAAFDRVFPLYNVSMATDAREAVYLHNDVLQLLVEVGWAGFALIVGAFGLFMTKMLRRIRRMNAADDPQSFFLAAGAFAGLASLSFHSFFDFNLQIPANAVYFIMLMAVVRVASRPPTAAPEMGSAPAMATAADGARRKKTIVRLTAAGVALVLLVPAWWSFDYGRTRRHLFYRDEVFAARSDPWLLDDADARYAYGRLGEGDLDWAGAAAHYRRAALLDPLKMDAWLGLGEMRAVDGDPDGARRIAAFCQGQLAPLVRWKWRQSLLTHELGMTEAFAANVNFLITQAFKTNDAFFLLETHCRTITACALDLLAPVNRPAYLNWAMRWGRSEAAAAVWSLLEADGKAGEDLALDYVHFLLARKEAAEARRIWLAGAGREPMSNGGFEAEPTGKGYDWRIGRNRDGHWRIQRVAQEGRDGSVGLRVDFGGQENVSFAHLSRIVPVTPEAVCRLGFWWKTRGLTTDQRPFVEVMGHDVGGLLMRGMPVAETSDGWQQAELIFTPPADCHAVLVRLRRLPSRRFDCKIAGHLWLDDFQMVCR
ncbi:MAG: O-antigen ligase family protein, partial [Desulfobacteraceae bacterium]|nr:O-antigen ligase family protein [Desulfobacteraceae bacterium]